MTERDVVLTFLPRVWAVAFLCIWLYTLFDMVTTPDKEWREAGYRKSLWIWAMFLVGLSLAPLVLTVYFSRVRPRIRARDLRRNLAAELRWREESVPVRPALEELAANWSQQPEAPESPRPPE